MILPRIKAAYKAFINPILIHEAESLQNTVDRLFENDEIVVLEADVISSYRTYKISVLTIRQQIMIKHLLAYG